MLKRLVSNTRTTPPMLLNMFATPTHVFCSLMHPHHPTPTNVFSHPIKASILWMSTRCRHNHVYRPDAQHAGQRARGKLHPSPVTLFSRSLYPLAKLGPLAPSKHYRSTLVKPRPHPSSARQTIPSSCTIVLLREGENVCRNQPATPRGYLPSKKTNRKLPPTCMWRTLLLFL